MREIHVIDVVAVILERVENTTEPFVCTVNLNGETASIKAIGGYNPNIDIQVNNKKLCLFDLDAAELESIRSQVKQVPHIGGV